MTWPEYYPPDCPCPSSQLPNNEHLYRLVSSDPPTASDFIPRCIEHPEFDYGVKLCQACGLSLSGEIGDLRRIRNISKRHRTAKIAACDLEPALGMLKKTPSINQESHYTWWVPIEIEPHLYFQVEPE